MKAYFKYGEQIMKIITKLFLVITIMFSGQLLAADLTSAKNTGLIGEQANGYIGFVKSVPDDVRALVKTVNEKRKVRYKKIAKSKQISLSDVAKIGGKKAIEKTKVGNYIKHSGGSWIKKL